MDFATGMRDDIFKGARLPAPPHIEVVFSPQFELAAMTLARNKSLPGAIDLDRHLVYGETNSTVEAGLQSLEWAAA